MTGTLTPAVGVAIGLVVVAVLIGVVDIARKPGWAWKAAGEPRLLCLALVIVLPVVGLAIYVFGARPKVVAVTSSGRAAALPFERFADRAESIADNDAAIGALSLPTMRGSFGEAVTRPIRATTPVEAATDPAPSRVPAPSPVPTFGSAPGGGFFDDPDVLSVGAAASFFERGAMTPPTTVAAEIVDDPAPAPDLHIPGSAGRPYNPRQRESLDEGPLERPGSPSGAAARAIATPTMPAGPSGAAGPVTSVASVGGALTTLAAPRVGTSSPEIFRPKPQAVAPIAGSGTSTALMATLAARWMNDPTGRHQYRYWDGANWTENVYDAGVESRDPTSG
jgi:hypothetical protein